ncbi:MAG: hypothetical protein EOP56_15275 [Sphingobacteriales bacterium]|nr:MAG: hypothetical protein EOP56_15275 [Sphingobacteriales bacterium]
MTQQLIRYNEPMTYDELDFLSKKEAGERAQYYRFIRIAMILSFICPFVIAWLKAIEGMDDPFSIVSYFGGVLLLLAFSGVAIWLTYKRNLGKIHSDLHYKTKTIEQTHITRKQFVPQNNTYHFYIDSPIKLSIEVTPDDYRRLDKGDELSIEYSTYSQLYLGYF